MGVREKVAGFERRTWVPETEDGDGAASDTKFAGTPWVREGEAWPACASCGLPLQLFLQLNAAQIPEEARADFGAGIVQLFYCTNIEPGCELECEAWNPGARSVLARRVDTDAPGGAAQGPGPKDPLPARLISRWKVEDDFPHWLELEEGGMELFEEEVEAIADAGYPRQGDKLGGWPHWVQGIEYPDCPECGTTMRLVFQIDSEKGLDYLFGDAGIAHLTQCPQHPERLAFAWACS